MFACQFWQQQFVDAVFNEAADIMIENLSGADDET
jgi:hypothetical protein